MIRVGERAGPTEALLSGTFIVFEGAEGGGKTTQIRLLADYLKQLGVATLTTREPGGTALGERIRDLLLDPGTERIDSVAETLLYIADRAQHVREVVRPALDQGKVVISDRYTFSTLAYQGYGRGLDLEELRDLNRWATAGLAPDLWVFLTVDASEGLARATKRQSDRLENEGLDFHERVEQGYRALSRSAEGVLVLDGTADRDEIQKRIRRAVDPLVERSKT